MKNLQKTAYNEKLVSKITGKALCDYKMIANRDKVLVGVSGRDSLSLLHVLNERLKFVPITYKLTAVHIDLNGQDAKVIEEYLKIIGIEYHIIKLDLNIGKKDVKTGPCFWCSWRRREEMFKLAGRLGCRKIAFAHHLDDILETFLMNLFYHGEISAMPPKLRMFKGKFHLIRPFCYLEKRLIEQYAAANNIPKTPYICEYGKNANRAYMKQVIADIEKRNPFVKKNIFRSMLDIRKQYLPTKDL
ncbi:MAG: ATP-binding protein [Candidatus Omnitrophota bacterium]